MSSDGTSGPAGSKRKRKASKVIDAKEGPVVKVEKNVVGEEEVKVKTEKGQGDLQVKVDKDVKVDVAGGAAQMPGGGGGAALARRKCPYLDTIKRHLLDFDFEKVCSISLSNQNVYVCLVCGKYFQGRGKNTHAYTHSVQCGHHVFMHVKNSRVYCLPDNYEVIDASLQDIQYGLHPKFAPQAVMDLNKQTKLSTSVHGINYLPGFIGLGNLKSTDFVNVVIHALAHVDPLRDFFLQQGGYADAKSELLHRFGELTRKMWSAGNLSHVISPHELMQQITLDSKKRFLIGQQSEPMDLMGWLLNNLNQALKDMYKMSEVKVEGGRKLKNGKKGKREKKAKSAPTIIETCFQGEVEVTTEKIKKKSIFSNEGDKDMVTGLEDVVETTTTLTKFKYLSLEIPEAPLFKDSQGGNVIPQVPLYEVLQKFDGDTMTDFLKEGSMERKKYRLKKLPQFIIFHLKRFVKNNFFMEKNPTIVHFPVRDLDLRDYVDFGEEDQNLPKEEELQIMGVAAIKGILANYGVSAVGCVEKQDLIDRVVQDVIEKNKSKFATKYNLLANIVHDSPAGTQEIVVGAGNSKEVKADPMSAGTYRVHVQHQATNQWYEIQDLDVRECMPQLIGLSESVVMIYELQKQNEDATKDTTAPVQEDQDMSASSS